MFQATLGDLSGLERYVAASGTAKKFDMVDGGEYDGDKACKFRSSLPLGGCAKIPVRSCLLPNRACSMLSDGGDVWTEPSQSRTIVREKRPP